MGLFLPMVNEFYLQSLQNLNFLVSNYPNGFVTDPKPTVSRSTGSRALQEERREEEKLGMCTFPANGQGMIDNYCTRIMYLVYLSTLCNR